MKIPLPHWMHAVGGRRKPPKRGQNSDFCPNRGFSQRYRWCMSGVGYVSTWTLSEYYLLPTPWTRHIVFLDKIALRMRKSQSRSGIFEFGFGIYYRVPLVNRLGWDLWKFGMDSCENMSGWCKSMQTNQFGTPKSVQKVFLHNDPPTAGVI